MGGGGVQIGGGGGYYEEISSKAQHLYIIRFEACLFFQTRLLHILHKTILLVTTDTHCAFFFLSSYMITKSPPFSPFLCPIFFFYHTSRWFCGMGRRHQPFDSPERFLSARDCHVQKEQTDQLRDGLLRCKSPLESKAFSDSKYFWVWRIRAVDRATPLWGTPVKGTPQTDIFHSPPHKLLHKQYSAHVTSWIVLRASYTANSPPHKLHPQTEFFHSPQHKLQHKQSCPQHRTYHKQASEIVTLQTDLHEGYTTTNNSPHFRGLL